METESRGWPLYHLKDTSLKVPERSLYFKESESLIISICVWMDMTCSYKSVHPSNLTIKGYLKFSSIDAPISHQREVHDLTFQYLL